MFRQFDQVGVLAVPVAVCILLRTDRKIATTAIVWLSALAFSMLYEPISPRSHSYLRIPPHLMLAVNVAVLTQLIVEASRIPASFRLLAFLLVLGLGCRIHPDFCARPSLEVVLKGSRTKRARHRAIVGA